MPEEPLRLPDFPAGEAEPERGRGGAVSPAAPAGARSERWRPVPDWPYEASDRGRVRSLARGVPLKPQRDDGYRYVELTDGRRRWRVHVARLVLLAHRGEPPEPGME